MDKLSVREYEIAMCLTKGMSNKEIANHLMICVATVKAHMKGIGRKLNAQNRTQMVVICYRYLKAVGVTPTVPEENKKLACDTQTN